MTVTGAGPVSNPLHERGSRGSVVTAGRDVGHMYGLPGDARCGTGRTSKDAVEQGRWSLASQGARGEERGRAPFPAPREGVPREGAAREGVPREGATREGVPREGAAREGAACEGAAL
ncbi:hypothetical protein JCM9957A_06480 [Kineosporia succinea]